MEVSFNDIIQTENNTGYLEGVYPSLAAREDCTYYKKKTLSSGFGFLKDNFFHNTKQNILVCIIRKQRHCTTFFF